MWAEEYEVFRDELGQKEKLLWTGSPKQGLIFRSADLYLIPFALMFTAFSIFWESSVLGSGAPLIFRLWGIPFILVGLYMLAGRFVVDALQRGKTYYALTNERIIIVSGFFSRSTRSLSLRTLPELELSAQRDGKGTITFGHNYPQGVMYRGMWWPGTGKYLAPCFEGIDNSREVFDQIRKAQREA